MIDPNTFRQALSHFATGVTVVTTRDATGQPIGVTASSFNTVSLDPPLVLWSIGRRALSYSTFATSDYFAVHVLGDGQAEWSNRFGRASASKFEGLSFGDGLGGVPLFDGCPARFECRVEHRYEGGDHLILVGRVHKMDFCGDDARPLLFHRGRYACLAAL